MAANTTLPFKVVWGTDITPLGSATRRDSATKTIYIPMTTSRSFRNVQVRVTIHDNNAAGTSDITSPLIGIKLGAAAFSDETQTDPSANSGENQSFVFVRDVTSYFNTNFGAGASQTCQVGVQFTASGTPIINNITIEIIGSVDVDTVSDNTQFNYVEFMCDSTTGSLTATLTEVGTTQFPELDTALAEASKTIRQVWIEIEGNDDAVGTVNDAALGIQINSETEVTFAAVETANAGLSYYKYIYDVTSLGLATNSQHAIKIRSTNVTTAATFPHPSLKVCVFYEYSWSGSTRITNFAKVPFRIGNSVYTSTEGVVSVNVPVHIQEPGTITMLQSGIEMLWNTIDGSSLSIGVGAQLVRTYTPVSGQFNGGICTSHRIDAGGAQGAALTISRGTNNIVIGAYSGASTHAQVGFHGFLNLVYSSDKSILGRKAHIRSIPKAVVTSTAALSNNVLATGVVMFDFLDTAYYVVGAGYEVILNAQAISTFAGYNISIKSITAELPAVSYYEEATIGIKGESETFCTRLVASIRPAAWRRWATDPKSGMDLKGSRSISAGFVTSTATMHSITTWICYHGNVKTFVGIVENSGGATVTIRGYSESRKECIGETSRSGDGAFSITWYDDASADYRITGNEDSSHSACSSMGAPT